jgi:uncharacterized repeat protein (TIGR03803 family)
MMIGVRCLPFALLLGLGLAAMATRPAEADLTTLVNFNGTNGANPQSNPTVDSSGNVFGTTPFGGSNNLGTVYEVKAGSQTFSTVANFGVGVNGTHPFGGVIVDSAGNFSTSPPDYGLVIDAQGNLYGTTAYGGTNGDGSLFEITPSVVPEPVSLVALGQGMLALACVIAYTHRRRASRGCWASIDA